jgi:methionyl-tRNA formyltransferase
MHCSLCLPKHPCIFAPGLSETTSKSMENKAHQNLRIVFMGTPEFAVASLDALVREGFNVVGVVTAPDKPAGRGLQLQESAVKKYASSKGLRVLQPLKLRDPEFLETLKSLQADVQVVVAFRMLPEVVWNMPPLGTINVHGSLLPQYRGAAPINWVLINGEKETGVTTFKLQQEIDTGNILLQETDCHQRTGNRREPARPHERSGRLVADKNIERHCRRHAPRRAAASTSRRHQTRAKAANRHRPY